MRVTRTGFWLSASLAAAVTTVSLSGQRGSPPPAQLDKLKLPAGFTIRVFAENVPNARQMAFGAKGTLFVGSMSARNVYAVRDKNGDGVADDVKVIAEGLAQPSGIAFRNGSLYVAAVTRILRYDNIENALDAPPQPVVVYDQLPQGRSHTWKYLGFGPDGLLYVPVGAPCNICEQEILDDPRFATIMRMKPDGTGAEIFAHGVRNTVGFDWHPATRELWFTDNGRDEMGDDVPNDELNVAPTPKLHFGYPYCHQGDVADPLFGAKKACADTVPPAQKVGPHVAAIGMRFYTGAMFPAAYRGAIFMAQHGSWNRSVPIGYRVMVARVDGRKVTSFDPFVEGFLQGVRGTPSARGATGDTFGRPADVQMMPDGSLLISDDQGGRIYRVTYGK